MKKVIQLSLILIFLLTSSSSIFARSPKNIIKAGSILTGLIGLTTIAAIASQNNCYSMYDYPSRSNDYKTWVPGHYEIDLQKVWIEGSYEYKRIKPKYYHKEYNHRSRDKEYSYKKIWIPGYYKTIETKYWVQGYWQIRKTRKNRHNKSRSKSHRYDSY